MCVCVCVCVCVYVCVCFPTHSSNLHPHSLFFSPPPLTLLIFSPTHPPLALTHSVCLLPLSQETTPAIDRLTDTSKYTGTHKLRFDESGKGRGLAGRDSSVKGSGMAAGHVGGMEGYVQGYKHEGTYDKKVAK